MYGIHQNYFRISLNKTCEFKNYFFNIYGKSNIILTCLAPIMSNTLIAKEQRQAMYKKAILPPLICCLESKKAVNVNAMRAITPKTAKIHPMIIAPVFKSK